jgi:hypothetical protein
MALSPAADLAATAPLAARWGWLPALSLAAAAGLLIVAAANMLARAGAGQAQALFWTGFLVLAAPPAARLASAQPGRRERLGLVLVSGLAFYLVKVLHSPYAFTFSDELLHQYNTQAVLQYGVLFHPHPVLPVIAYYPGLASAAAALAALGGLPVFTSGLVVIGAARLVLVLSLFLFYEQVSGSARAAGVGALLYMAHSNFLYWSAQFSYESLALPLAALVAYAAARAEELPGGRERAALTWAAALVLLAVVVTHHLTSYALVGLLWLAALACLVRWRLTGGGTGPWELALAGLAAAGLWVFWVAPQTLTYLSIIFSRAFVSFMQMLAGLETARRLFQSNAGHVAPLWERVAGIASVLLLAAAQPLGLVQIARRYRTDVFALLLSGAAVAYFAMLALRFTQAGWETGNRASDFLFVGLAFVTALAAVQAWDYLHAAGQALLTGGLAIVFMGGLIAGWPRDLRLGGPYRVAVAGRALEPQGVAAAAWLLEALGPDHAVAADSSNALLLLNHGDQAAYSGRNDGFHEVIAATPLADWQLRLLRREGIEYVLVDRRRVSWDSMAGYYFVPPANRVAAGEEFIDPGVNAKFERQDRVSRLFDSGDITLYDVRSLSLVPIYE